MRNQDVETPDSPGAEAADEGVETPIAPEVMAAEAAAGTAPQGGGEDSAATAELERLSAERKQLEDQLLRQMAEFQNFRRRKEQEMEQSRVFATERLVTALLPVLDNFERTLAALEAGAPTDKVIEGIRAIDRQFRSVLEGHQVRRIQAQGQPFDPDLHEAIAAEPTEEHPEDTVVGEIEPGYRMADKVIRPARVRVARRP